MPISQISNNRLGSNYFEVTNEITIKIEDANHKAKATYDIIFKNKFNEEFDIEINRLKFLLNQKEVENKFSMISHEYFQSIFPLQFKIVNDTLELVNYKALSKSVNKIDNQLVAKFNGEGLSYIRDEFFKQIENESSTNEFISSLGFVTVLNLVLKRFSKREIFTFKWKVPSIGFSFWKMSIKEGNKKNSIVFHSDKINSSMFLEYFNHYLALHQYDYIQNDTTDSLKGKFEIQIDYEDNSLNVLAAYAKCSISFDKHFNYDEMLNLKSMV